MCSQAHGKKQEKCEGKSKKAKVRDLDAPKAAKVKGGLRFTPDPPPNPCCC